MTVPRQPENGLSLAEVNYLTVAEVATIMRVSKMTVYRLCHDGELECLRVGRSFRIPAPAVNIYLRNCVVPAKELRQLAEKPPVRAEMPPVCPGGVSACPELKFNRHISI